MFLGECWFSTVLGELTLTDFGSRPPHVIAKNRFCRNENGPEAFMVQGHYSRVHLSVSGYDGIWLLEHVVTCRNDSHTFRKGSSYCSYSVQMTNAKNSIHLLLFRRRQKSEKPGGLLITK